MGACVPEPCICSGQAVSSGQCRSFPIASPAHAPLVCDIQCLLGCSGRLLCCWLIPVIRHLRRRHRLRRRCLLGVCRRALPGRGLAALLGALVLEVGVQVRVQLLGSDLGGCVLRAAIYINQRSSIPTVEVFPPRPGLLMDDRLLLIGQEIATADCQRMVCDTCSAVAISKSDHAHIAIHALKDTRTV